MMRGARATANSSAATASDSTIDASAGPSVRRAVAVIASGTPTPIPATNAAPMIVEWARAPPPGATIVEQRQPRQQRQRRADDDRAHRQRDRHALTERSPTPAAAQTHPPAPPARPPAAPPAVSNPYLLYRNA